MANEEQGTHFYFMTGAGRNALGLRQEERAGVTTLPPGTTRWDAYQRLRDEFARDTGLKDFTVIAFDVQPNQL